MKVKITYPSGSTHHMTCDDTKQPVDNEDGTKDVAVIANGEESIFTRIESMEVIDV